MLPSMAKKTASKTPSEKKTATKKSATKTAAKKTAAKKTAAKKTAAKKSATKKSATKKSATKKSVTKKTAAKSAPVSKPVVTKPPTEARAPSVEENIKVVKDFIAALERIDFDGALALCAPNIIWVNEPFKTASSREQLGKTLRSMFGNVTLFRVENLQIGQDPDGTVHTDRIDIIRGGGLSMRIRVQGVFVVENGQIVSWVDRFSWPEGVRQTLKCLPSILRFQLGQFRGKRA